MKKAVFYSWQSDTPENENHYLVRDALQLALKDQKLEQYFFYDEATRGVPGNVSIFSTIMQKIDDCEIAVADLTVVGRYPIKKSDKQEKATSSPNVLVEYGYALARLGEQKIIAVMNTYHGSPDDLPFNPHGRRVLTYDLPPASSNEDRKKKISSIAGDLRKAIELIWVKVISGGLTELGLRVVKFLVNKSEQGRSEDPEFTLEELCHSLEKDKIQTRSALDELIGRNLLESRSGLGSPDRSFYPTEELFFQYDPLFMGWDPRQDARKVAEDLVASPCPGKNQIQIYKLAQRYGWEPRRINPALQLLAMHNLVRTSATADPVFAFVQIWETTKTREFARGRLEL